MEFVTVQHPDLGTTLVPVSRVPFLSKGWQVVEAQPDTDPAVDNPTTYEPAGKTAAETPTRTRASRGSRKES